MASDMNIDKISEGKSPIIEGSEVTFIYRGQAETVYIAGEYSRWEVYNFQPGLH